MKRSLFLAFAVSCLLIMVGPARAQGVAPVCQSITVASLTYTQDFDMLASAGTSSIVPAGFGFAETGTASNTTYGTTMGTATTGDTYSFGNMPLTDRAFGGLQSGSLIPTIGACFVNNVSATVTSLVIRYDGEMYRLGNDTPPVRLDRLDFQYSTDAISLTTGTWIDVNELDFVTPNTGGTAGVRDGNDPFNRTAGINFTILNLSIPNGSTFYIRYLDFNAAGSDDGLAIDNFSLTPQTITAARVSLGGRVLTANGRGIRGAAITIEGGGLAVPKRSVTGSAGFYNFEGLEAGQTYIVSIRAKRYVFQTPSLIVNLDDDLTSADFVANP